MLNNIKIFVIPGGGGKTTLCKNYNNFIDIDDFWDANGKIESEMIKEFKRAQEKNNHEIIQKLIKDCMNYKAIKLKNHLNKNNVIILVQSVEQANIIFNDKNNIFCFVPDKEFHELTMEKRKDNDFVKEVCRKQREDIINSGWKYIIYNDFKELDLLIKEAIKQK